MSGICFRNNTIGKYNNILCRGEGYRWRCDEAGFAKDDGCKVILFLFVFEIVR